MSDRCGWRDALAIFSVAAPIVTLIATSLGYAAVNVLSESATGGSLSFSVGSAGWNFEVVHPIVGTILFVIVYGQAVVALLALLGLRRCAAVAAVVPILIGFTGFVFVPSVPRELMEVLNVAFLLILPIAEIVALLVSPGPRYGRRLMRRGHWVMVIAVALLVAAYDFGSYAAGAVPQAGPAARLILALAPAVLVLMIAAAWLASAAGKRLAVLLAILGYPMLQQLVHRYTPSAWTATVPFQIGLQAVTVLLIAVLITRVRRAKRRPGDGGGAGMA